MKSSVAVYSCKRAFELPETSEELCRHFFEKVHGHILEGGWVPTIVVLMNGNSELQKVIDCTGMRNSLNSEALARIVHKLASEHRATAYAFSSRMWAFPLDGEGSIGWSFTRKKLKGMEACGDPWEVFLASAQIRGDKPTGRVCKIIRGDNGKAVRLVEQSEADGTRQIPVAGFLAGIF